MPSFLYKEFDEYAALWEDVNMEAPVVPADALPVKLNTHHPKNSLPSLELNISTFTKEKFLNSTISSLIVAGAMGAVELFIPGMGIAANLAIKAGALLAVSSVVTKILETATYHNLTRGFSGIRQLAEKNPSLKKEIYRLALEVGHKNAAKVVDSLENYINSHPEILEADAAEAMLELLYDPVEGKKITTLALIQTQEAAEDLQPALAEDLQIESEASAENEEYIASLLADPKLTREVQIES